jgi:DNA invertase Pin-like site-specific DNA recombinase
MIVGYARTSSVEQIAGLEAQERDLKAAGSEKIYSERVSSIVRRPELEAAFDFLRDGDTLVVTKLDRLARSVADLVRILGRLGEKGVTLRVMQIGLDTSTPTGKLMLNLLGSIAEFERDLMLDRQREGIAKAKADGKYKGRKPTARARASDILELTAQGLSKAKIAAQLGISQRSVFRVLSDEQRRGALR